MERRKYPCQTRAGDNERGLLCMSDLGQLIAYWGYPAIFVVVVLGNVGLPVPVP